MPEIELDGQKIDYHVRHSERASRARIDAGIDELTVVIPDGMDLDPKSVLQENQSWVLKKRREYQEYLEKIPDRTFEEGAEFPFLGTPHTIEVRRCDQPEIVEGNIILRKDRVEEEGIKNRIESLYREKARKLIQKKADEHLDQINGTYKQIYIRDQKTRWGSCSGKANLSFNWRIVMAPEHVLEYVAVHELVHLEIRDHSEDFWTRLREIHPEYKKGMTWLKNHNHELHFNNDC